MFFENCWYVAAWSHEIGSEKPVGRMIIGLPIVLFKTKSGKLLAMEDRCLHRRAPLSLGRVEGEEIRCMYHGLKFNTSGQCTHVPGAERLAGDTKLRVYPVVEKNSWIWVWTGDESKADESLIPDAYGLDNPAWAMRGDAIDYEANYELINDNLCDLSHLDYVHERTLRSASGAQWSKQPPKVTTLSNGLLIERWFIDHPLFPNAPDRVDTFNSYRYLVPGLFLMITEAFAPGAAAASSFGKPDGHKPVFRRAEQQAVTPMSKTRTRYLYATGVDSAIGSPKFLEGMFGVVNAAFAEDKAMIEAQQRIWNVTDPIRPMAWIAQDKAPAMMRRMIAKAIVDERKTIAV